MKYIAIIGYGVVGGGITELVRENQQKIARVVGDGVEVKYILDLREFPDSPYADRVVHTLDPILADGEVELVCETMGGSHPALEYSLSCMKAGKSVVTSNKEVVANFGDVLSECAKENGVSYLFEASVGGGIPVIRSFATSLPQDEIVQVSGIVNGTTNYILTRMEEEALSFEDALKEAQELGYAEHNPSADVDGIDAKRKIMILSALAGGILPGEDDVYAGSLRGITQADLAGAARLGGRVKLIAEARLEEDGLTAYVCPMIVKKDDPLGRISGVYNGISVRFALTGDILYYGRGAGRYPTAGAIVADVCAGLSGAAKAEFTPVFARSGREDGAVKSFASAKFPYYVRAEGSASELLERLEEACGSAKLIAVEDGIAEIETGEADEKTLTDALCGVTVQSVLRIRR